RGRLDPQRQHGRLPRADGGRDAGHLRQPCPVPDEELAARRQGRGRGRHRRRAGRGGQRHQRRAVAVRRDRELAAGDAGEDPAGVGQDRLRPYLRRPRPSIDSAAMNTILGANGVIGRELSRALFTAAGGVRQVSRHPRAVNSSDETMAADLLDPQETASAVSGSTTAYLVAGLAYDARVWEAQWP